MTGVLFSAILALCAGPPGQAWQGCLAFPTAEEVKANLLETLNAERASRNLGPLRPSPALERLALRQSEDMARLGLLSHASATGLTLSERLAAAKVYFRAHGENVARSGTFLSSVIHESLMNSRDHRENILDPRFDEVGIGVVQASNRAYYVTQDFVQSLDLKPEPESLDFLLRRIREVRGPMSLPALEWVDEISVSARDYACLRAAGKIFEAVPGEFRGSQVSFTAGPDLAEIADLIGKKSAGPFVRGGLGVFSGRTPEYPGGGYYVCAILLPASPRGGLGPRDLAEVVFQAANSVRREGNFEPLMFDGRLNRAASASRKRPVRTKAVTPTIGPKRFEIVYETPDLTVLPTPMIPALKVSSFRKVGIAVSPATNKWGMVEYFTVAVVLARS